MILYVISVGLSVTMGLMGFINLAHGVFAMAGGFILSTLMARGASEGRQAIDFSQWSSYSPEEQRTSLRASCRDVRRGTMPMKAYLRLRRDARLSTQDIETICSAARQVETTPATIATRQPRTAP